MYADCLFILSPHQANPYTPTTLATLPGLVEVHSHRSRAACSCPSRVDRNQVAAEVGRRAGCRALKSWSELECHQAWWAKRLDSCLAIRLNKQRTQGNE